VVNDPTFDTLVQLHYGVAAPLGIENVALLLPSSDRPHVGRGAAERVLTLTERQTRRKTEHAVYRGLMGGTTIEPETPMSIFALEIGVERGQSDL
jgi:hypothetical protein